MKATYLWRTVLAAQVVIPLLLLTAERPARFAWQMFSTSTAAPTFGVEAADGTVDTLSVEDVLVMPRIEIDFAEVIPPRLCEREPHAVAVRTFPPGEGAPPTRQACP